MGEYWKQDSDGKWRKGSDEADAAEAKAFFDWVKLWWPYVAWLVVGAIATIYCANISTEDWDVVIIGGSIVALIGRFLLLRYLAGYSHLWCTIIGLAAVACSYFIHSNGSFLARLYFGLLV